MLDIESVNHIGIRIRDKERSVRFYGSLGFDFDRDTGFEEGHPIVMRHPSGVVLNLLGPASDVETSNILMDVSEKHTGITHFALTVASNEGARSFVDREGIEITGSFSFDGMSAIFIRDPDRNVIELDSYEVCDDENADGYQAHST